jgi:hypothetical protein
VIDKCLVTPEESPRRLKGKQVVRVVSRAHFNKVVDRLAKKMEEQEKKEKDNK